MLWLLRRYGGCSLWASAACKAVWVPWGQSGMVSCNTRASQVHSGVLGVGVDSSVLEHSSRASSCGQHEGVSSSAKVGSCSLQQHEAWIRLGLEVHQQLKLNLGFNLTEF